MISPINFTGIRNVGYARSYTKDENENDIAVHSLNLELTDDKNGKDLSIYKALTKNCPELKNKINGNFLNLSFESFSENDSLYIRTKVNGNNIKRSEETSPINNFMDSIISRIKNFKKKDFDTEGWHHMTDESLRGLIYDEDIQDYLDGSSGTLDLLNREYIDEYPEGKSDTITQKLDRYINDGTVRTKGFDKKIVDATDYILETLYNPMYVHNGAVFMDAIVKSMNESKTSN